MNAKLTSCALFILILFTLFGCNQQTQTKKVQAVRDVAQIVRRSNILYDSAEFQKGYMHIPPFVSNGVMGGCFDHMGFQSNAGTGLPNGRTLIGYANHYYMHKPTTRQIQMPLTYIQAEFADGSTVYNMMDAKNYKQELDIYTGVLTTTYDLFGETKIIAFAPQNTPNLFVYKVDKAPASEGKELIIKINCEPSEIQNRSNQWPTEPIQVDISLENTIASITSTTNMVSTKWKVESNNPILKDGNTLLIRLKEQENTFKIWVDDEKYTKSNIPNDYSEILNAHTDAWATLWEKSWVDLPEEREHHIWTRGNYYNLSNFSNTSEKALIPTGVNGNIWGFTFPQDVYYVAENLLRSGHFEKYKLSMKYWLDILPEVKKYSRRIMDVEDGFYPWTPPFDQWDEFEKNGVVGNDSYEIHNPAYVSAMVWHYYIKTKDEAFLKEYFPIMEAVWRFYTNVSHANEKGTFDVDHHKAAGQDEASRLESSKNLLCASYSAEYTARNYLQAAELVGVADENLLKLAKEITEKGYERETLLNDKGYYVTYEGDIRPTNSQKHPVQLNAITFCPMSDLGQAQPSLTAYQNRYELTSQAQKPISHGWTYAAFALASSRLGNGAGLDKDLSGIQYCAHADPRWIQFYEYTFWERWTLQTAYYFPTHGLYQQAITDALVQDWQGYTELFASLIPKWRNKCFSFKGLYTHNNVSINGTWDNGKFRLQLIPNGADNISIKTSLPKVEKLMIEGSKNLTNASSNELIELEFEGNAIIEISN